MAEPPERNSSTSMPVCCLNRAEIFCACSIGVDVYQLTFPSALALAISIASCAFAEDSPISAAAHSASLSLSMSCSPSVTSADPPFVPAQAGTQNEVRSEQPLGSRLRGNDFIYCCVESASPQCSPR